MAKDVFTVHWKEMDEGEQKKFAESFETKSDRDNYMEYLKEQPDVIVYRFTDFEILTSQ